MRRQTSSNADACASAPRPAVGVGRRGVGVLPAQRKCRAARAPRGRTRRANQRLRDGGSGRTARPGVGDPRSSPGALCSVSGSARSSPLVLAGCWRLTPASSCVAPSTAISCSRWPSGTPRHGHSYSAPLKRWARNRSSSGQSIRPRAGALRPPHPAASPLTSGFERAPGRFCFRSTRPSVSIGGKHILPANDSYAALSQTHSSRPASRNSQPAPAVPGRMCTCPPESPSAAPRRT